MDPSPPKSENIRDSGLKSSQPDSTKEEVELERLLNREATAFNRELEVERILKAFKLKYVDAYVTQTLGDVLTFI